MVVEVHGEAAKCTCNGEVLEEAFKLPANGPSVSSRRPRSNGIPPNPHPSPTVVGDAAYPHHGLVRGAHLARQTPQSAGRWEEFQFLFEPDGEPIDAWLIYDNLKGSMTQTCSASQHAADHRRTCECSPATGIASPVSSAKYGRRTPRSLILV